MQVYVDGKEYVLATSFKIRNQYGWIDINQIELPNASCVEIILN